jgi:hypothetical protein
MDQIQVRLPISHYNPVPDYFSILFFQHGFNLCNIRDRGGIMKFSNQTSGNNGKYRITVGV